MAMVHLRLGRACDQLCGHRKIDNSVRGKHAKMNGHAQSKRGAHRILMADAQQGRQCSQEGVLPGDDKSGRSGCILGGAS